MMGIIKRILLPFICLLLVSPAYALDEVVIHSEDGDFVGQGLDYRFTSDLGTFTVSRNSLNGISVEYTDQNFIRKQINLAGPDSSQLSVGVYNGVQRFLFAEAGKASMSILLAGGCNRLYGSFEIFEVTYLPDGSVDSFAADLEHYCESSLRKLTAHIRINSTYPIGKVGPIANAGIDQVVLPASNVQLNGSLSATTDQTTFTYNWAQLDGVSVILVDAQSASPTFTTPSLPNREYEILKFQLTITDSLGRQSVDEVVVNVSESLQPQSFLHYVSNEFVGRGETRTLTESATIPFEFVRGSRNSINFKIDEILPVSDSRFPGDIINLGFAGVTGQEPEVGNYEYTSRYGLPDKPDLNYYMNGRTCSSSFGILSILEVAYADNGSVERLAINFEQTCTDDPFVTGTLFGYLRYNSTIPIQSRVPITSAGKDLIYHDNEVIMPLDGSFTRDTDIAGLSYQWQQISGPAVVLNDPSAVVTYFTAPINLGLGEGVFEFELIATNAGGYSDSDRVQITVLGPNDPKTYFYLDGLGDANDFVTQGNTYFFKPDFNYFTNRIVTDLYGRKTLELGAFGYTSWSINLASIGGVDLQSGVYGDAHRFVSNIQAQFDFSGDGRACNVTDGSFTVHEISFNPDGSLNQFAADFIQSCDSGSPAIGVIRINSLVPFIDPEPTPVAGRDQVASIGETVNLDGSYSWDLDGIIAEYMWTQIGGASVAIENATSEIASFNISEGFVSVDPLVFQLTVLDDDGRQQVDIVSYSVIAVGEPVTGLLLEGNEGDFIFSGPPQFTHNDDADFSIVTQTGQQLVLMLGEFQLELRTPVGETFALGNYENAVRPISLILNRPGMSVISVASACNVLSGRFSIIEMTYDSLGDIDRLAVDFEVDCEADGNAFFGSARINSLIPLRNPLPNAAAGPDSIAASGEMIVLDGSKSRDANGTIVFSVWKQIMGPSVTIVGPDQMVAGFTSLVPADSDVTLVFELTVTDNNGNIDTDEVTVTVKGVNRLRSIARMFYETNTGYDEFLVNENNGYIRSFYSNIFQETSLNFYSEEEFYFTINPSSTQLVSPGLFDINDSNASRVFYTVRGNIGCSNNVGWLKIYEAVYDASNNLTGLAFDFEVRCNGVNNANWGSVRFNSNIPENISVPIADVGDLVTVDENTTANISASQSSVPKGDIVSYQWYQTSGRPITLQNETTEVVSFTAPDTNGQQNYEVELEVVVTTDLGYTDKDTVRVRVLEATNLSPMVFNLVSPADNAIGQETAMTLIWEKSTDPDGGDISYQVIYCENSGFTGCSPVNVAVISNMAITIASAGAPLSGMLFFGMVFAGGAREKLKKQLGFVVVMVVFLSITACGGGGSSSSGGPSPNIPGANEVAYSVNGLSPATTYYWKVIANDSNGGITESDTWSFTTQ